MSYQVGCGASLPSRRHDELGLRDDGGVPAVSARDRRLPYHRGSSPVQGHARSTGGLAHRDRPEEVGFALDRGRPCAVRQLRTLAVPPRISAKAMIAPPCRTPLRLAKSASTVNSASTRSREALVMRTPMNRANAGWASSTVLDRSASVSFGMQRSRQASEDGEGKAPCAALARPARCNAV